MAKVTIVIYDSEDNDGDARMRIEFEPPLKREKLDRGDLTTAQQLGLVASLAVEDAIAETGGEVHDLMGKPTSKPN